MYRKLLLLSALALLLSPGTSRALASPHPGTDKPDACKIKLEQLERRIDSLEPRVPADTVRLADEAEAEKLYPGGEFRKEPPR